MTTRDDSLIITYAHCRKWTHGQLDRAPYSDYALMSLAVVLRSRTELADNEAEYYVLANNECIGYGASANEAIADAQWRLMNESRKQAQSAAQPATATEDL